MAILRMGGETGKRGEWFEIGRDPETGKVARVRVRVLAEQEERRIRAKYGRPKDVDITIRNEETGNEGTRVFRQNVYSEEDLRCIQRDIAAAAFTDAENFGVVAEDEEQVKAWRSAAKVQDLEAGVEFLLDGKVTADCAFYLCENRTDIAKLLVEFHNEARKRETLIEEARRKN